MGPYTETLADLFEFASYRSGVRQAPPYKPTTYWKSVSNTVNVDARTLNAEASCQEIPGFLEALGNKLESRFSGKLGDASSFGATLTAELNETVGMVGGTAIRLFQAARLIKKLRFGDAARVLGLPYRERTIRRSFPNLRPGARPGSRTFIRVRVFRLPTGREVTKTLANGWLLYSYGAKPLAEDMYTAMKTLTEPLKYDQKIKASASDERNYTFYRPKSPGYYESSDVRYWQVRGSCGATVSVENPNVYLCDKLGLTNPAQWVLEAIPFSFVIDWFSNLSQVVGSLVPYAGLNILNAWTCTGFKFGGTSLTVFPWETLERKYDAYVFRRGVSLPIPTLVFKYERFEPQRALNAISLLIGFLKKN